MTTTAELLTDAFGRIHDVVHQAVDNLTPEELAFRVDGSANSIAWLVWHLSRVIDDHISEVAAKQQVWVADGWVDQFALPFPPEATGYGFGGDDVAAVQVKSPEILTGYFDGAYEQASRYVGAPQRRGPVPGRRPVVDPAGDPGCAARQRDLRRAAARRAGHVHPWHRRAQLNRERRPRRLRGPRSPRSLPGLRGLRAPRGAVGPPNALVVPRYAGPDTFARLPRLTDVGSAAVAIAGIPFDSGVSYRPGARFGPASVPGRLEAAPPLPSRAGRRAVGRAAGRRRRRPRPRTRSTCGGPSARSRPGRVACWRPRTT